jgi:hypothetical protein
MKPFNQFDMEQQIMTCWNVCEDLDTLMEGVLERDMTRDRITNALMGMKELYQLKFETLFENFEALCRDRAQERQIKKAPGYTNYDRDDDEDDYQLNAHGEVL